MLTIASLAEHAWLKSIVIVAPGPTASRPRFTPSTSSFTALPSLTFKSEKHRLAPPFHPLDVFLYRRTDLQLECRIAALGQFGRALGHNLRLEHAHEARHPHARVDHTAEEAVAGRAQSFPAQVIKREIDPRLRPFRPADDLVELVHDRLDIERVRADHRRAEAVVHHFENVHAGVAGDKKRPGARDADAGELLVGVDAHEDELVRVVAAERGLPARHRVADLVRDRADFGDLHSCSRWTFVFTSAAARFATGPKYFLHI